MPAGSTPRKSGCRFGNGSRNCDGAAQTGPPRLSARRTLRRRDLLDEAAAQFRAGRGGPPDGPVEDGEAVGVGLRLPVVVRDREVGGALLELGLEDGLGEGARHVLGTGGLGGPADQRLHQGRRVDVGEVGLGPDRGPHLLSGDDHQRRPRGDGVGERAHRVPGTRRGVQVDQHRPSGRLGIAVRHTEHGALMEAEHIAEGVREVREEGQFVGTRVAEDGGESLAGQELVGDTTDGVHGTFTFLSSDAGHARQPLSPGTNKCFRRAL
jgi:hypothetical protein